MRCNIKLTIFASLAGLCLAGCNELGWNPLDPAFTQRQQQTELERVKEGRPVLEVDLALDVFSGGSNRFSEQADFDARTIERRRFLEGGPRYPAYASLVLKEAFDGGQVSSFADPKDSIALWRDVERSNLGFETLYETRNDYGPALWRRVTSRGRICVVFQQAIQRESGAGDAVLNGYYCSPAGEGLSEGQAEYVVQSIRLRDISPS